jgi:hypothetical protein
MSSSYYFPQQAAHASTISASRTQGKAYYRPTAKQIALIAEKLSLSLYSREPEKMSSRKLGFRGDGSGELEKLEGGERAEASKPRPLLLGSACLVVAVPLSALQLPLGLVYKAFAPRFVSPPLLFLWSPFRLTGMGLITFPPVLGSTL